jgi:hypothetical protein
VYKVLIKVELKVVTGTNAMIVTVNLRNIDKWLSGAVTGIDFPLFSNIV